MRGRRRLLRQGVRAMADINSASIRRLLGAVGWEAKRDFRLPQHETPGRDPGREFSPRIWKPRAVGVRRGASALGRNYCGAA